MTVRTQTRYGQQLRNSKAIIRVLNRKSFKQKTETKSLKEVKPTCSKQPTEESTKT